MALLTLTNAHLAFGHVALLDGADFALETAERVALIGRNGTGKSSMLKILAARGLVLVGLDVIGDSLTEINVTSPTCFQEITQQTGFDVAKRYLDALEAALG